MLCSKPVDATGALLPPTLALGGIAKEVFLRIRQAVDAGVIDLLQDAVDLHCVDAALGDFLREARRGALARRAPGLVCTGLVCTGSVCTGSVCIGKVDQRDDPGDVVHRFVVSDYLLIPNVPGISELSVLLAAVIGAGIGFLWYNTYPAQVFMGDVGALALGGTFGTVAVLSKNELLSVIIGGIFVLEAVSVVTQTTSYKLTGKRVFRMAPIHHHFELLGWAENKVVVRFWIVSGIFALLALSTLKLR